MRLSGHGIGARLPAGWEGSIRAFRQDLPEPAIAANAGGVMGAPGPEVLPVAHFATFALPPTRGDFGSNVVDLMQGTDAFVSLVEYGPEEANTPLFAQQGLPRRLDPRAFTARQLQRTLKGQSGLQLFFTDKERAFCLYVVLGDASDAHRLVRRVEQVLATVEIEEAT